MKKLNYFVIALFAVFFLFTISCKDEEEAPILDAPGVVAPSGTTVLAGQTVNMDFGISAPGKVAEVKVASIDGTASIVDATSIVGKTSGTVTVTYVAPNTEGTQTVTLTVTDQQATPKTASGVADVSVTTLDAPGVVAPSGTTAFVGEEITMDFSISAPGIIDEVTVAANEGEATVDVGSVIGTTSGTVTVTYTAPLTAGDKTVTLTVKDRQSTPKSVDGPATVVVTLKPESSSQLLVTQFASAPVFDGQVDDMWATAAKLVSKTEVPVALGKRMTYYNADGLGEEDLDIFEAYEGETNNFTMRSGYFGDDIYFLIEWEDDADSKDRQSWYFDPATKRWKGEHKYANDANDKFYEDKFAFLFPIGTVDGFDNATCYATCHTVTSINKPGDKHTRHYLKGVDQKVDMWHWKRVRGTHNDRIDDQRIQYVAPDYTSSSNGRDGDPDSGAGARSGYSNNKQTLTITGTATEVSVPMYVVPDGTDYYWIPEADIAAGGAAKLVTEVDAEGVLTYDGGTIVPAGDSGYDQGTGSKRFPSILTRDFLGERADISIKATHTGAGWVAEVTRKLDTSDPWDIVFDPTAPEVAFGFAIFNNAAIAHSIRPGLTLKFE